MRNGRAGGFEPLASCFQTRSGASHLAARGVTLAGQGQHHKQHVYVWIPSRSVGSATSVLPRADKPLRVKAGSGSGSRVVSVDQQAALNSTLRGGLGLYHLVVGIRWSNLHKLTDRFSKSESGPVFSPDGTEIVFSQLDPQAAKSDLWLMDPDGTIIPAHGYARGQRVPARLATV